MTALQRPHLADIPRSTIDELPTFRLKSEELPHGPYRVKCAREETSTPDENDPGAIKTTLWFKSPALDPVTIRRIDSIQLYAESHDQGYCDEPDKGNWTWLELGIYEDDQAELPRSKAGVDLIWRSHYNVFCNSEYEWCEGKKFEETHDLVRNLEDGNMIGVRLCSRFSGWEVKARNGYLVFEVGDETLNRDPPPKYSKVVSEITTIQDALSEVNAQNGVAFTPSIPDGLFRADAFGTGGERPLRVLSLDGGGVRGLMTLQLLKAVFGKSNITKKPCEVFDMIGGTSTGGIIAIMLGRLQMTIDECITEYLRVMGKVFPDGAWKKARFITKGEFYDATPLEDAIKEVVKQRLGDADAPLLDKEGKSPCKIFVMAVREDKPNNRGPVFLRSYPNQTGEPEFPTIKVWEAARATSAAPAYFKAFAIDKYKLLDGGLSANNPLGWLWTEVLNVFGPARYTDCFLTIGTGLQQNIEMPRIGELTRVAETVGALADVVSNTEIVHILFRTLINAFAPKPVSKKYWRLNVGTYLGDWDEKKGIWPFNSTIHHYDDWAKVGDLDDREALKELLKVMEKYIAENQTLLAECSGALLKSLKAD